jgi:hypothetical protein
MTTLRVSLLAAAIGQGRFPFHASNGAYALGVNYVYGLTH